MFNVKQQRSGAAAWRHTARLLALAMVIAGWAVSGPVEAAPRSGADGCTPSWVGAWATSPVSAQGAGFHDQTLRMIANPTISGAQVRVRLSNAFGRQPVVIGPVFVGERGDGAEVVDGTNTQLTFGGQATITIPAGADVLSDAVEFDVVAFRDVAVSFYLPGPTGPPTTHPAADQTSYISGGGDHAAAEDGDAYTSTTTQWHFLTAIDVLASHGAGAVVALGDSITDGSASTVDANHRWPDFLARRLAARRGPQRLSVLNAGIGGNRILSDGLGVNALARLNRDVLTQTGVTDVVLLEGINDIGLPPSAQAGDIIAGMKQIVSQVRAHGLNVIGGTLTPAGGSALLHGEPLGTTEREAVNHWIRTGGWFDEVIDFDAALRDPADPSRLQAEYDSGDHLHPSDAGYKAMAAAVDLDVFRGRDCRRPQRAPACTGWTGAWAASTQPTGRDGATARGLVNQTVRMVMNAKQGGSAVRVRLSNTFGTRPVTITHVFAGLRDTGAELVKGTNTLVTFGGSPSVTIPPGAQALSDPAPLRVDAFDDIAISVFAPRFTGPPTVHYYGETSYLSSPGDHAGETAGTAYTSESISWFFLEAVDVLTKGARGSVVAIGDSITDGSSATRVEQRRWPDVLARRLHEADRRAPGVLNHGIGGNQVRGELPYPAMGTSAVARLDRDVLTQTAATDVIVFEGINDIGLGSAPAEDIIAGLNQIAVRSRAKGLNVVGATLTPAGYAPDSANEAKRTAVNEWIRTSGAFDAVIDFDAALRNPEAPETMIAEYDSGDGLHPSDAGYQVMGDSIDLKVLRSNDCAGRSRG